MLEKSVNELKPREIMYYRNCSFDAYIFLVTIFSTALKEIIIIDPYADMYTLATLKLVRDGVKVYIIADHKFHISQEEIEIFHRSHNNVVISIIESINEHDRHIIIDHKNGYLLGSSINTIGHHDIHITSINDMNYLKQIIDKYIKQ